MQYAAFHRVKAEIFAPGVNFKVSVSLNSRSGRRIYFLKRDSSLDLVLFGMIK